MQSWLASGQVGHKTAQGVGESSCCDLPDILVWEGGLGLPTQPALATAKVRRGVWPLTRGVQALSWCGAQEARARETITALKGELDQLNVLVESGAERDNEEQIARLMVEKEDLLSERDAQVRLCPCIAPCGFPNRLPSAHLPSSPWHRIPEHTSVLA